jgi:hypothetical protein
MSRWPVIKVTRSNGGVRVKKVEWGSEREGEPLFDLTGMKVMAVETKIDPEGAPTVQVTFIARLVEVEEE